MNNAANTIELNIPSTTPEGLTALWANHPTLSRWVTGQAWAWEGGDALTIVVGEGFSEPHFIIRHNGETTYTQARGIRRALSDLGIKVA